MGEQESLLRPAQMLATEFKLEPLSDYQEAQVSSILGELTETGFPVEIKGIKDIVFNIREGTEIANTEGHDTDELKRNYAEGEQIFKRNCPRGNFQDSYLIFYKLEKYLRQNYTRQDVVENATRLDAELDKTLGGLQGLGYDTSDIFIVGSYAKGLPRKDSDLDIVLFGNFDENPSNWRKEQERLNQLLSEGNSDITFDHHRKEGLIDIFPRPASHRKNISEQGIPLAERPDVVSLVPRY